MDLECREYEWERYRGVLGAEEKEDMKDASGEGEQECWFGEGGCLDSSEMES